MRIPVNKDFLHEYKNEFWKGFTIPELASIVVGLTLDGIIVFLCWKYLHISPSTAVYIGMPALALSIFVGFKKMQDNANLLEYVLAMRDTYQCRELSFCGETTKPKVKYYQMQKKCADGRHKNKKKKGGGGK